MAGLQGLQSTVRRRGVSRLLQGEERWKVCVGGGARSKERIRGGMEPPKTGPKMKRTLGKGDPSKAGGGSRMKLATQGLGVPKSPQQEFLGAVSGSL